MKAYGRASHEFPAGAPEVRDALERLSLPLPANPLDRVRKVFAFVSHEVATTGSAGSDAMLTLAQREGSPIGQGAAARHAAARGRRPRAPRARARPARELAAPDEKVWCEAWLAAAGSRFSPVDGFFAERPEDLVALGDGGRGPSRPPGRRRRPPLPLAARAPAARRDRRLMEPENPVLASVSLYQLPVGTQSALRALLLFPLGALIVALFRNVVGVPTYGTFMPLLVAFALRGFSLGLGSRWSPSCSRSGS